MAQFKVKNLMVDIASAKLDEIAGAICHFPTNACVNFTLHCRLNTYHCPDRSLLCRNPTLTACFRGSCFLSDGCGVNYSTCMDTRLWVIDFERLVINPDDIKAVQGQLNEALKALSVRSEEISHDMKPKTVEQAEMLEAGLKAALEEVQAARKEMGK
ncbi:MAG: hypothetical protein KDH15_01520 [Rhodocyclaceae bacterium]|nr:hypothetical protein [Rhodocyclaceae bacterium]